MSFDTCLHQYNDLVLKAGAAIRKLKGLPDENNVTALYNETLALLGVAGVRLTSSKGDRLPAPHEIKDGDGRLIIPRKDCTFCGEKEGMKLYDLCRTCKEAEGGKYKSKWECFKCRKKEIYEKPFVKVLDEFGIEFKSGFKKELGIETVTDDGVK